MGQLLNMSGHRKHGFSRFRPEARRLWECSAVCSTTVCFTLKFNCGQPGFRMLDGDVGAFRVADPPSGSLTVSSTLPGRDNRGAVGSGSGAWRTHQPAST